MEKIFNTVKTNLINAFSPFGKMILAMTETVKKNILDITKKTINVFDQTIRKIAEFSKMLLSAGSDFIVKYVKVVTNRIMIIDNCKNYIIKINRISLTN